jgi:hypothetical protein
VELLDEFHVAVQGPEKTFDGLLSFLVPKTHGFGHPDLVFKVELIAFSAAQVVEPVPHRPDEGERL